MARIDFGMDQPQCAVAGEPDALFELGMLYSTGLSVAPDLVAAHQWFNLAALRGNKMALAYRRDLALEMTSNEIAEAQRRAREWLATGGIARKELAERLASLPVMPECAAPDAESDEDENDAPEECLVEAFATERLAA